MTNEPSERTPIEEQVDQVFNEDSEWQDLGIYFFSDVFPDFMEFEGQMKALGAWFLHLQGSLEDFLEAEKAIFVTNTTPPTAEEVDDLPDDFFWDEAAQHDGASDDLAYSTQYGPRFAFGSIEWPRSLLSRHLWRSSPRPTQATWRSHVSQVEEEHQKSSVTASTSNVKPDGTWTGVTRNGRSLNSCRLFVTGLRILSETGFLPIRRLV